MTILLVFKALHIFFMIAWFAGLFYLPRIFVYHAQIDAPACDAIFKVMARRLLFFVTPFAVLTLLFGSLTIYSYGYNWFIHSHWLHYKLALVFLLYCYHGYRFKLLRDFALNRNRRSPRFYRVFNEMPVLVLLAIILLAYLKPA